MKVLIVCSHNNGRISPFIMEQVKSLNQIDISTEFFLIEGKGVTGYLKNLPRLRKHIKQFDPDLIHAHYGLSGLLACLQTKKPVITTFHGSDIHQTKNLKFSKIAIRRSVKSIFVSPKLMEIVGANEFEIPCGVDIGIFVPMDKLTAKRALGLTQGELIVIFPATKTNPIKNYNLAKLAIDAVNLRLEQKLKLMELKDYSREEVAVLMNASEFVLLTSLNEGSPQVIKEAMACNVPIVSTNVGSVPKMLDEVNGSYITDFGIANVTGAIEKCLRNIDEGTSSNGREILLKNQLDLESIAQKIKVIYSSVLQDNKQD